MAGGHGEGVSYKGLTMHKPKRWDVVTGKGRARVLSCGFGYFTGRSKIAL
jgi:hypothetical protein